MKLHFSRLSVTSDIHMTTFHRIFLLWKYLLRFKSIDMRTRWAVDFRWKYRLWWDDTRYCSKLCVSFTLASVYWTENHHIQHVLQSSLTEPIRMNNYTTFLCDSKCTDSVQAVSIISVSWLADACIRTTAHTRIFLSNCWKYSFNK